MKLQWTAILFVCLLLGCKRQFGIYCTQPDYTAYCYELKKDGRFVYNAASCIGASQGIGEYKIIKDTLKLIYEKHKIEKGTYTLKKVNTIDSNIVFKLQVLDSVSRVPIAYYSAALYSAAVLIGGTEGDLQGQASLSAAFNQSPIKIEISYLGYAPVSIEVKEAGEYTVEVELVNGNVQPEPAHEVAYKLIAFNKDSMLIGSYWAGDENWTNTLYKVKKRRRAKRKKE